MTRGKSSADIVQGDLFNGARRSNPDLPASKTKSKNADQPEHVTKQLKGSRFLSIEQVALRYGVGQSTIWRWVAKDDNFPKPLKLSKGTSRWLESHLRDFERNAVLKRSAKKSKAVKGELGKSAKGWLS